MTRYLITTQSYRHEYDDNMEIPTQYGYLVETDLKSHLRLLRIETPTETPHGERIKTGLRGVHIWHDRVYVACWNRIDVVDYAAWRVIDSFDHPLMSDLHGLHVDDDGIWVTSSLIDSVLVFDHDRTLRDVFAIPETTLYPRDVRQAVDRSQDYRLRGKRQPGFLTFHANHVTHYNDKRVLITGRGKGKQTGRVLCVDRETLRYRVWADGLGGPHDGLWLADGRFAVTETDTSTVAILKPRPLFGPKVERRLQMPKTGARFWTRGLCQTPDGTLLVGQSVWKGDKRLAKLVEIDLEGEVRGTFDLQIDDYPECRIFQIVQAP